MWQKGVGQWRRRRPRFWSGSRTRTSDLVYLVAQLVKFEVFFCGAMKISITDVNIDIPQQPLMKFEVFIFQWS